MLKIIKYLQLNNHNTFIYLLALVLISIPLKLVVGSVITLLFVVSSLFLCKREHFKLNTTLILPIILYGIMFLSLLWSTNFSFTLHGLQKTSPFLFIPLVFLFIPEFTKQMKYQVVRIYSFGMVLYAIYSFIRAFYHFYLTHDEAVFLFHNLVTLDLNAIYIAAFASLCLFYFIDLKNKKTVDFIAIYVLVFFVLLLSSKTIIFIDILLLIWYYIKYMNTNNSTKWVTVTIVATFVFLSLIYVKQVRNRFLAEYETAFVDNTINKNFSNESTKIFNISLHQAWKNKEFLPNSSFPGTAYRVFQARIFIEMLQEQNIWLTGFGQDASEESISIKNKQYSIFKEIKYYNFHNQYIQIFAELGIFGFIVFILIVLLNLKNAIQKNDFLHTVFAVTMLLFFLTESILCRQRGILFFIVLFCIFNSVKIENNIKIVSTNN